MRLEDMRHGKAGGGGDRLRGGGVEALGGEHAPHDAVAALVQHDLDQRGLRRGVELGEAARVRGEAAQQGQLAGQLVLGAAALGRQLLGLPLVVRQPAQLQEGGALVEVEKRLELT